MTVDLFDPEAELVRLHEAGHAVAYREYGLPFEYVTSTTLGQMRGHLQPRTTALFDFYLLEVPETHPTARRMLEKLSICALAGALAEGREPYGPDLERAQLYAPDGLLPIDEARDFVAGYKVEIRRAAAALALSPTDTLTEREVQALV